MSNFMYLFVNCIFNLFLLFEPLQLQSQKNQVSAHICYLLFELFAHYCTMCIQTERSNVSIIFLIIPYILSTFPSNDCFQRSKIC